MKQQSARRKAWSEWSGFAIAMAALSAFSGFLTFGFQCYLWLKDGRWAPFPIGSALGISADHIQWAGVRKIVGVLLSIGVAPALIAGPFLLILAIEMVWGKEQE